VADAANDSEMHRFTTGYVIWNGMRPQAKYGRVAAMQ